MPTISVLDSTIYYEDHGAGGIPVVFLHGNPSSSHTWRKVLPRIPGRRLLAPDLIGMGRSGKPEIAYSFDDHSRYLDAWFDALGLDEVILVGHDWGGALAFDWAARHPGRVRGVAFFEAIVRGMSWSQLGEAPRKRGELIRSEQGEELVLGGNFLVDTAYTGGVLTPVSDEEKAAYLEPYPTRESRRPLLRWARSIPLDGEPADVAARVDAYGEWLAGSETVRKLLLTFEGSPTLMITPELAEWCGANIAALETVHVGAAGHHATEDRPEEIASEIGKWIERL
ncbi:haloalkane dehalogenase [Nonomuraea sp. NPDC050663]|uniref:haloalkane dehalogenase n=1 Tax=Nonomuraea sp. NPDC050663 TaxID=3364370 RepID=UPI0037A59DC1